MKQITVVVTAEVQNEVTIADFKEYVEDAVSTWGGQFHPDDPLFITNIDKVKVVSRSRFLRSERIKHVNSTRNEPSRSRPINQLVAESFVDEAG